jgi:hypothetical protein
MEKEELGKFAFDRFIAGAKSDTARDYWYSKFKQEHGQKVGQSVQVDVPKETLEEWAYKNPVYSREEILELLRKSFPDKSISGVLIGKISASKQIYRFEQALRELGKSNAEKIMKQQTLEQVAEKLYPINNTGSMFMPSRDELNNSYKQEAFIEGAKWQQEQDKIKLNALDLNELESKLDVALNNETSESLTEWIETKRNNITSVEWLIETLSNKHIGFEMYVNSNKEIIEQANDMNQQEIVTAYQEGTKDNFNSPHFGSGLNYFRETYKK